MKAYFKCKHHLTWTVFFSNQYQILLKCCVTHNFTKKKDRDSQKNLRPIVCFYNFILKRKLLINIYLYGLRDHFLKFLLIFLANSKTKVPKFYRMFVTKNCIQTSFNSLENYSHIMDWIRGIINCMIQIQN